MTRREMEKGETAMGDKGKKDKGKREQQKKAQLSLKDKRKAKRERRRSDIYVKDSIACDDCCLFEKDMSDQTPYSAFLCRFAP